MWLHFLDQSAEALKAVGEQVFDDLSVVRHEVALIELKLAILVEFSKNDEQAPRVRRMGLEPLEKHSSYLVLDVRLAPLVDFCQN